MRECMSHRGTNFLGTTDALQMEAINKEDAFVKSLLQNYRTIWRFKPPHATYMYMILYGWGVGEIYPNSLVDTG